MLHLFYFIAHKTTTFAYETEWYLPIEVFTEKLYSKPLRQFYSQKSYICASEPHYVMIMNVEMAICKTPRKIVVARN